MIKVHDIAYARFAAPDLDAMERFLRAFGLEVTARGDVGPGGTVTGASSEESVQVRVQAASWVDVDTLEVWIDGQLAGSVDLAGATDVVRFDDTVTVDIDAAGSYVIFHAKGDLDLSPVHPGRDAFAVSMPIFFEP